MSGNITLGCKARDRVSGFEGTVTSRHIYADGSVHFGVQPRVTKDKAETHPDAMTFDMAQLEFVASKDAGLTVAPYHEGVKINLGELVEDQTTKHRGIAMIRTDFMNGCVYFSVQAPITKKGEKPPKMERSEHFFLKKVGAGITKMMPKVKKELKAATPAPRSGGPTTRVERQ